MKSFYSDSVKISSKRAFISSGSEVEENTFIMSSYAFLASSSGVGTAFLGFLSTVFIWKEYGWIGPTSS